MTYSSTNGVCLMPERTVKWTEKETAIIESPAHGEEMVRASYRSHCSTLAPTIVVSRKNHYGNHIGFMHCGPEVSYNKIASQLRGTDMPIYTTNLQ